MSSTTKAEDLLHLAALLQRLISALKIEGYGY